MPTTTVTPMQLVDSVYAAFARGDITYIVSLVAPGAPWRQSRFMPWGGDFQGPSGAVEFFQKLDAAACTIAIDSGNDRLRKHTRLEK